MLKREKKKEEREGGWAGWKSAKLRASAHETLHQDKFQVYGKLKNKKLRNHNSVSISWFNHVYTTLELYLGLTESVKTRFQGFNSVMRTLELYGALDTVY